MKPSPSLFDRIQTCAHAISFFKENKKEYVSSHLEEVMKCLPPDTVTPNNNANLITASLAYLKLGFADHDTPLRKVKIALYVAIVIADDKSNKQNGLAKEICKRFRFEENFDREQMMKIFNFSLCNDSVLALLDKTMVDKTNVKNACAAIDHELRVEFIMLYFSIMTNLVGRGQSLVDLGYAAHLTSSDMKAAKLIVEEHASSIATKCWTCFDLDALKKPRPRNTLFPAGGAFPRVSIVREHVDFDEATTDTLKGGLLLDRGGKQEFVGIMRAIVSLAADGPVATYRSIGLESIKAFFMETILKKAQAEETTNSVSELAEVDSLKQEIATLKDKVSGLEMLRGKYRSVVMMLTSVRDERDELKRGKKKMEDENWLLKAEIDAKRSLPREYGHDKKARLDKFWLMGQAVPHDDDDEEYSGDEDE